MHEEFRLVPAGGIEIEQQIRWGDLDALGHVNNTVYFQFCESARIAYFTAIGIERFKTRPTDGPGMVSGSLNFRRQLHYPGRVTVTARATRIGEKSYTLSYVIRDAASGEVAADGESACVWVDYAASKAMPLPAEMVARIREIEQMPQG
ncbi:MAG: acyl-CoA thioesterase [Pirellulales bacterium]|nr:acyl-CoA thioesterase [Pirellulales bacterium]